MQDVLLLDTLRGYWDNSNQALYYSTLLADSVNHNGAVVLPHQRQELDPAYKWVTLLRCLFQLIHSPEYDVQCSGFTLMPLATLALFWE